MVLADLETILIRATYSTTILRSSISDVAMEIASEGDLMTEPAYEVERCDCPNGYEGLSCEVRNHYAFKLSSAKFHCVPTFYRIVLRVSLD